MKKIILYDESCSTQQIKEVIDMGTTEWLVQEGKCKVVHENYSNARDAYLDAVKRNKKLRASDSIFDRVKAKRIEFRPLN